MVKGIVLSSMKLILFHYFNLIGLHQIRKRGRKEKSEFFAQKSEDKNRNRNQENPTLCIERCTSRLKTGRKKQLHWYFFTHLHC